MRHKTTLLSRRSGLPKGIFVEDAYPDPILTRRLTLRAILRLAKKQPEYKCKCRLDDDQLIIKGNRYSINTLHKLPSDIAPYKAAQLHSEKHNNLPWSTHASM